MKKLATLFALALLFIVSSSSAQENQDAIIGTWDADERTIEIHKSGDKFIGNPVGPKGKRIEKVEILNLGYKDDKWVGSLYAEKRDKTFDVVCEVLDNKLMLKVDAGFISREVEWTRIK